MRCLSELGKLDGALVQAICEVYGQTVRQWIMGLLAGTEMQQAAVYTDAQYVAIGNKDIVAAVEYNFISGFISQQPEHSFQHARVRLCRNDTLVSVINCHAASSYKETGMQFSRLLHGAIFSQIGAEL